MMTSNSHALSSQITAAATLVSLPKGRKRKRHDDRTWRIITGRSLEQDTTLYTSQMLNVRIADPNFGFMEHPDAEMVRFACPICTMGNKVIQHTLPDKSKWKKVELVRKLNIVTPSSISFLLLTGSECANPCSFDNAARWCVWVRHADLL